VILDDVVQAPARPDKDTLNGLLAPVQALRRVELRLQTLVRFEFSFQLGFGNGDIDHKAESVRDLPSR
jgi:hypothetical protein